MAQGVDVLKTDGGDSEVAPDLRFNAGMGDEFHNLYQLYFAKGVYDQMEKQLNGRRGCIWIRSGISGLQRFPCSWGGDQPATFASGRILLIGGQNVGLGGVCFWSHDLGGFSFDPTEEYYIRSIQWGLISPLSRAHGGIFAPNEPWAWGQRACDIFKKFARTRYRLLPYIYSIAHEANRTGTPLMRAMLLEFPSDPVAAKQQYQYMFGPSMLVAPVYDYSNTDDLTATRPVYLPKETWYDYWTGRKIGQSGNMQVNIPIDTMPIYIRAGSIIPTLPETPQYIDNGSFGNKINLDIYAGADGSFTLYEDDGISNDYKEGMFATTRISYKETGSGCNITISPRIGSFSDSAESAKREWRIMVHSATNPKSVLGSSYGYDEEHETLTLMLPSASGKIAVNW